MIVHAHDVMDVSDFVPQGSCPVPPVQNYPRFNTPPPDLLTDAKSSSQICGISIAVQSV